MKYIVALVSALTFGASLDAQEPASISCACSAPFAASGVGQLVAGHVEIEDVGATQESRYVIQRFGNDGRTAAIDVNPGTDFFDALTWDAEDNGSFWWYRISSD